MTQLFNTRETNDRAEGIAAAVEVVRDQQAIVLPTDTVYGIGVDAFSAQAVAVLLAAKGRGRTSPPPVLIGHPRILDALAVEISESARKLADEFWPGPLTLIFQAQPSLTWDLGETRGTVALRVPDDEIARELLDQTGPMAVSSANRHGKPAATTIDQAQDALGESVAVYLDAGERADQEPSTIIDCTQEPPLVVRTGALSIERLCEIVPDLVDIEDQPAQD